MKKAKMAKKKPDIAVVDNNMILTSDVKVSLDCMEHKTDSLNVMIIGKVGTGKTRGFILPNILQGNTNYVITDPKGEILRSSGQYLTRLGYEIKVFNLIDMRNSENYNPFSYVWEEDEEGTRVVNYTSVKKMVNVLMKNVGGGENNNNGSKDPFWDQQAEILLCAVCILLLETGKPSEQNFYGVSNMLDLIAYGDEKDKNFKSELDKRFEELQKKNPNSLGHKYYREFKQGSKKTLQSIVAVAIAKIDGFNVRDVANLTHTDTMDLTKIGDKPTAVFVIIPADDSTFNFLAAMMYTQMFNVLYKRAKDCGGALPCHVRFLLDEFANIGQIPEFDKLISTFRSLNISVSIILQSYSQLKALYEKSHETIYGNCECFLFLGSAEESTLKLVSERLGKETIDIAGKNRTKGGKSSTSENNSIVGRELLDIAEVAKLKKAFCILFVSGYNPMYSKKFDLTKHVNYRYLAQADSKNIFEYSYVKTKTIKQTEEAEALAGIPIRTSLISPESSDEKSPELFNIEVSRMENEDPRKIEIAEYVNVGGAKRNGYIETFDYKIDPLEFLQKLSAER
jgi:type IV secretion system protein VirD4